MSNNNFFLTFKITSYFELSSETLLNTIVALVTLLILIINIFYIYTIEEEK